MRVENEEAWRGLCALASHEENPEKLLALLVEINRLFEVEEAARMKRRRTPVLQEE